MHDVILAHHGADGQVGAARALQDRAGDEADTFAGLQDPGTRRALRQMASAAVHGEHASEVLAEFTAQRRAALRVLLERGVSSGDIAATADLDMLTNLAYGVLWYRVLIGHAPLNAEAADDLATHLIAAGQAVAEGPGADGPSGLGKTAPRLQAGGP